MERRKLEIRGIVQGVGFRPFVYGLADRLALGGFVRNTAGGVVIEVEGDRDAVARFQRDLLATPPPLASIDTCTTAALPVRGDTDFRIDESDVDALTGTGNVRIPPDVATCDACLSDLSDPCNRRYRYPFVTCATCGPRLTVITGSPYDRERTTMARFEMCASCRIEYEDPLDRRFHAETIACSACGPRLELIDGGFSIPDGDPVNHAVCRILDGRIGAIKGVGGYHLVCDAQNPQSIAELRRRKHRDEKPFAVMFADVDAVAAVCALDDTERAVLTGPARPIVLLSRRGVPASDAIVPHEAVAPGCPSIGALLPSNPVQHLLLRAAGRPLLMTSGNRSQEPVAYDDANALDRLRDIADFFLINDRPIHVRCDDSVSRIVSGAEIPVRRSRGDAPRPLRLPVFCPRTVLAVGGHLKNTFAFGRHHDGFLSHHVGDLDDHGAFEALRREIPLYEDLLRMSPDVIAHDRHPDYGSTRYARERAHMTGAALVDVQHHHAHVASCMAEHGLAEPVIGVAFDGSGYGDDGTVWGGEFLVGDAREVRRMAHLRPVALPGGEQAVREPWRMALSHLADAGESFDDLVPGDRHVAAHILLRMMDRRINAPMTSSAGRLFDAVAALAEVRHIVSFEGQAAMELEWLSAAAPDDGEYPHEIAALDDRMVLDTRPLIRAAAADARAGRPAGAIGRRFHRGLAAAITAVCARLCETSGIDRVILTGGVFLNGLLTTECTARLERAGLRVFRHRLVPPNDGGLSLGQLTVAAARLESESCV
ncbi:MAG TPA: carbamoyltransferase HypF [Vicinamibacterales bacterium]|nr:carbamoyltransferase HypF [Vicinamibacterales bacterium]